MAGTVLLAGCQQAAPPEPINERPVLNLVALPDIGPTPLEVELVANASDPEGEPLTYYWFIEADGFEGAAVEQHTFTEPGEYTVGVTASDGELDAFDEVTIIVLEEERPGL